MDLDFSQDQDELRAGVRSVLENESPPALARSIAETGARPDALWKHMVELGWPALTVPEAAGGIGLGAVELAVLCEELGRAVAPGPLLATVAGFVPIVRECASAPQAAALLGPIADGERRGTFAHRASAELSGATLTGTADWVLDGDIVDDIALVAGDAVVVVPREACTVEPIAAFDPTRGAARLRFDGVRVEPDAVLANPSTVRIERALEEFTVALACEMVGTAQQVFDIALAYAKERHQFGVPIGSFQAIKHKFADLAVLLERARATAYFAALTIAEDDEQRSVAASVAKAAAGDLAERSNKEGIQVLGGIGYTWEHDMHLYVRRLTTDAALLGGIREHRARIAAALFG